MTDTIVKDIQPKIGDGIYSVRDIASILHLPYHKVRSVFNGFWNEYSFGDKGDRAVNFWTLIEFYTYYRLREKGVTALSIKKAHTAISKHFDTIYPFAMNVLKTDGKGIWYKSLELLINADGTRQINIENLIEPFLHKVEFNSENLAQKYYPLTNSKNIVIDPKYHFGQPVIAGTRIKAEIINDYVLSGENIDMICKMYDINEKQVKDAVSYFSQKAA